MSSESIAPIRSRGRTHLRNSSFVSHRGILALWRTSILVACEAGS